MNDVRTVVVEPGRETDAGVATWGPKQGEEIEIFKT